MSLDEEIARARALRADLKEQAAAGSRVAAMVLERMDVAMSEVVAILNSTMWIDANVTAAGLRELIDG